MANDDERCNSLKEPDENNAIHRTEVDEEIAMACDKLPNKPLPQTQVNDYPEPTAFSSSSYWRSIYFIELISCGALYGLSQLFSLLAVHERPVPFQLLQSGLYVRNQVYNEFYDSQETVPETMLLVLTGILPVVAQIALSWFAGGGFRDTHGTVCTYLLAFAVRSASTNSIKRYCGYLRPVFYDLCQPDSNYEFCQKDSSSMRESFPSGHASQAFCGLTLLTLFIHYRFGISSIRKPSDSHDSTHSVVRYSHHPSLYRLISLISLIPMGVALFIAASRVRDNRHFPADVVGGSVLGAGIAFFSYGLWF